MTQDKCCNNCHYCYHHPDGALICNNPKLSNGPWEIGGDFLCEAYEPAKSLEECIELATPQLSKSMAQDKPSFRNELRKEEKCCGDCCWFKFEDIDGFGICEMPHGIAKKRQACGCEQRCSDASCKYYISEEQAERYLHVLTEHNKWRRDDNVPNSCTMQDPKEIGKAIDFAIDYCKTFMKL